MTSEPVRAVHLGELTRPMYDREVQRGAGVILPVGALEQHGSHLPLATDVILPTALSAQIASNTGWLVAPAIQYGYKSQPKSGGGNHHTGTTSLDANTLILTIRDIITEFARHGVRKLCIMNGHFENAWFITEGCDLAIRELQWGGINDLRIIFLSYWDFVGPDAIAQLYPDGFAGWDVEHGGVLETSLMLRLRPDLVDMTRVSDFAPATFPPYDLFPLDPDWIPASGCLSSAINASAEKGELLRQVSVDGIGAALIGEFGRVSPPNALKN